MVRANLTDKTALKPGAYVLIHLYFGKPQNYPTVPETALVYSPTSEGVYVVENGRALLMPVKVGQRHQGMAQITEGLSEHQIIINSGQGQLFNGALVSTASSSS